MSQFRKLNAQQTKDIFMKMLHIVGFQRQPDGTWSVAVTEENYSRVNEFTDVAYIMYGALKYYVAVGDTVTFKEDK